MAGNRHKIIGTARFKQIVFRKCSRRHQPDDIAAHHSLRTAFAGLRRIFQLFADGHAMTHADQFLQIGVSGMNRHAAHRDILALVFAALRQRDTEVTGGDFSVLEEQFVEIAHPVKQQAAGVCRFNLQKLCHDGCCSSQRRVGRLFPDVSHVVHGASIAGIGQRGTSAVLTRLECGPQAL